MLFAGYIRDMRVTALREVTYFASIRPLMGIDWLLHVSG